MRLLALGFLAAATLPAQVLTFSIMGSSNSLTPFPTSYQFPDTSQGSGSSIMLKATNASSYKVLFVQTWIGDQAGSAQLSPNFTITGQDVDKILAPGDSEPFTLNFTPAVTGSITGYLQVAYAVEQNGCTLTNPTPATTCPTTLAPVSTLQGNATAAGLVLSYDPGSGLQMIQPDASSPLNFGGIVVGSSKSIVFTLTNDSSSAVATPAISLPVQNVLSPSSAFSLDTSSLAANLPAGGSTTFTVTYAPQQENTENASLVVGTNAYALTGTGTAIPGTGDDPLQIVYVDSTGVRTIPQGSSIDFGQLTAGTATSATLSFTVTNPSTSFDTANVGPPSVTGTGFSISFPTPWPTSLAPGASASFSVTLSAGTQGTASGTLSVGAETIGGQTLPARVFSLTGKSVSLPLPSISLQVTPLPLTSQEQATLTIQLASASSIQAIGQLAMSFTPSVANVTDDPAINFIATNSRTLQVNIAAGAQNATYNGQSAIAFQTGTTAGTINFTLTFPELAPITKSVTIPSALIVLTSAKASWQEPNLVVTVDGFDNTYSAGQLQFMFYNLSGNPILPNGMQVNATSQFQQYFFTNNPAGGAFSLQASFPVSGEDVTQIGSVMLTMSNSAGQTSTNRLTQ